MASPPTVTPMIVPLEVIETPKQVTIYVDETRGSDEFGTKGTKENPFEILFAAYHSFPPGFSTPSPVFYTAAATSDSADQEWKEATKTAMKKVIGRYTEYLKKLNKAEEEERRQLALVEARKVVIKHDESLPAPKMKISTKNPKGIILGTKTSNGARVKVVGRIDNIRASKTNTFVYLSDTRAVLLCIFSGQVNVVAPILFQKQASLEVYGEMKEVPAENKAPGDRELMWTTTPSSAKLQVGQSPLPP